jgi:hypothetical protein
VCREAIPIVLSANHLPQSSKTTTTLLREIIPLWLLNGVTCFQTTRGRGEGHFPLSAEGIEAHQQVPHYWSKNSCACGSHNSVTCQRLCEHLKIPNHKTTNALSQKNLIKRREVGKKKSEAKNSRAQYWRPQHKKHMRTTGYISKGRAQSEPHLCSLYGVNVCATAESKKKFFSKSFALLFLLRCNKQRKREQRNQ